MMVASMSTVGRVKHLLEYRQIGEAHLGMYLHYYSETVKEVLGDDAAPLLAWFTKQIPQYKGF